MRTFWIHKQIKVMFLLILLSLTMLPTMALSVPGNTSKYSVKVIESYQTDIMTITVISDSKKVETKIHNENSPLEILSKTAVYSKGVALGGPSYESFIEDRVNELIEFGTQNTYILLPAEYFSGYDNNSIPRYYVNFLMDEDRKIIGYLENNTPIVVPADGQFETSDFTFYQISITENNAATTTPTPELKPSPASSIGASTWASKDIESAIQKGYVPGSLQYDYTNIITRQEFCQLAVKFVEYATGSNIDSYLLEKGVVRDANAFSDSKDPDVLAAFALGITSGTGNSKFTPNGQITREQAATMIRNICMVIGVPMSTLPTEVYADISNASTWATESIYFCYSNKVMSGTRINPLTFSPKAKYTREQSIVTFNNIDIHGVIDQAGYLSVSPLPNTQPWGVPLWANISSVQQFEYMNKGLAYAYIENGKLQIKTPDNEYSIDAKYPLLGDVISDSEGCFYVVWGIENKKINTYPETTFISKYSPAGEHVKTIGFVGNSSTFYDSDESKTQKPFSFGNCVSAISNGVLINYHAKLRYDGHQIDQVIGVRIADMSVYDVPHNTYTGHSFNQSILYSEKKPGFVFASHGDGFGRGFKINSIDGEYGDKYGMYGDKYGTYGRKKEMVFHFYLEPEVNYNMAIVNSTFAQLGGIVETSEGIALVGASAKTIGEEAKKEKQNLFVQIADPVTNMIYPSISPACTTRTGQTSYEIYNDGDDNTPLSTVTDYGVHWLTDYTDKDVVAPQVVVADDKIVILWSSYDGNWESPRNTLYMVLSANGNILTPATSLKGVSLNSYEQPVYHDGTIYWASVSNGRLKIRSIDIAE